MNTGHPRKECVQDVRVAHEALPEGNLRKDQPWNGRTEDSVVAMKMDSWSSTGFKAGRTRIGKFGVWQNTANYAWQTDMQTVTKLTVKSVSEVFPVVSEAWTSTIR